MIPILYKPSETDFTTNGLGRLSDCISCIVTEERNSIYEMSIEYPMEGIHFSEIENGSYIKAVPFYNGDPQLFVVYEISKPINWRVKIYCAHVSYRLSLIPVRPFEATSAADCLAKLKQNALEPCPFDFWTDRVINKMWYLRFPATIKGKLQGDQWSILQNYKPGEYEWDNYTVKLWTERGSDKGVTLRYGKNIIDLKQEENIRNTVTGICPYWYGFVGDATDEELVMLPENIIYTEHVDSFPYKRTGVVDLTDQFEEKPTVEQLRSRAQRYINENDIGIPDISIKVSFVDLGQTMEYKDILPLQSINLCDTVTIRFEQLGVNAKAKVTRTVWNVLLDRYDSIGIGNISNSLPTVIAEQSGDINSIKIGTSQSLMNLSLSLNQQSIFNRLTNNGAYQGMFMEDGQIYINATYLKTGEIDAEQVQVINLIADKVLSYTPDTTKRAEIVGGRMGYQGKTDYDEYKDLINLNATPVQGAVEHYSGVINLFQMETDGTYTSRVFISSDSALIGINPLAIKLEPEDATGEVAAGNVYANHHIVLGPGSDTPDGTFAIGYFRDQHKNVELVTGLSFIDVNINGTTYKLLGKVAT